MARGLTWTVQYQKTIFDDIDRLLEGLQKKFSLLRVL